MLKKPKWVLAAVTLAVTSAVHAGDVNFSGFLSVGGGVADDEFGYNYAGYDSEDFTFDNDSVFGLQVSSQVSDKLKVTGQFVARGTDDYSVSAEWAYISYEVNDRFTWRMGRFRTPLYLYSDFVDVGYAYSWIRTPRNTYYLPFNNVQGVDFLWRYQLGSWDGSVQGYYGALTDDFFNTDFRATIETELRNQMGVAFSVGNDWLTLRAAYHQADLKLVGYENNAVMTGATCAGFTGLAGAFGLTTGVSNPCTVQGFSQVLANGGYSDNAQRLFTDDSGSFMAVGFTIDTGTFVAAGETIEFEIEDAPFSIDKRWYVMGGVRFGDVLIHATYAETEDEGSDLSSGIAPPTGTTPPDLLRGAFINVLNGVSANNVGTAETVSVGLRWDFTPGAAFKVQYDMAEDSSPSNPARYGKSDVELNVLSFAIQTVF